MSSDFGTRLRTRLAVRKKAKEGRTHCPRVPKLDAVLCLYLGIVFSASGDDTSTLSSPKTSSTSASTSCDELVKAGDAGRAKRSGEGEYMEGEVGSRGGEGFRRGALTGEVVKLHRRKNISQRGR